MISKSPLIQKGQHRNYLVLEQRQNSTIVLDLITNESFPCKKIYIPPQQKVILYIKKIEQISAEKKIWFDYSLLNDYREGESFEFDIISRTKNGFTLENNENKQLFLPASLCSGLNGLKRIRLTVKSIELKENKLFFAPVDHTLVSESGSFTDELMVGESYNFNVNGYREINNTLSILLLERKGFNYSVRGYEFQKESSCPDIVRCIVQSIQQNKVYLSQDKYALLNQFYEEGKKYPFKVISLEQDENVKFYLLEDKFHLRHRIYFSNYCKKEFETLKEGAICELFLKRIEKKGYLLLSLISVDLNTKFYSVEEVFGAIGVTDANKYFYNLKNDFEQILDGKGKTNPVVDHNSRENHWLFTYLQFIPSFVSKLISNERIDEAKEFLQLNINLEKWILEGSDFLNNFSFEKKDQIILKAEYTIQKSLIKIQACNLIQSDGTHLFIERTLSNLTKSGRLRNASVLLFKEILALTNELLKRNIDEIIEIISLLIKNDLLDEYESGVYRNTLESRIIPEKKQLNQSLELDHELRASANNKTIVNICKILLLQILLDEKAGKKEYAVIDSANFLRYLSLITTGIKGKKELLKSSVACITSSTRLSVKLTDLDSLPGKYHCRKLKELKVSDKGKQLYLNNGSIYKGTSGWHLFSSPRLGYYRMEKELQFTNIASFYNGLLNVASKTKFNLPLTGLKSFRDYSENWEKYYQSNFEVDPENEQKIFPLPNEKVEAVVKCIHKDNCQLLFLKLSDSRYRGEGVLHISELLTVHLTSLEGLFFPDERLVLRVKESEKQLSFSLKQDIWELTRHFFNIGDFIDAQVVSIKEDLAFTITERGAPGVFIIPLDTKIFEGGTYRLKVINNREDKMTYFCEYHSHTENKITAESELRQLLKKYFIIYEEHEEIPSVKLLEAMIGSVKLSLEALVFIQENLIQKLEGLFILKLICSITKDSKSYYFDQHIKHIITLLEFNEFSDTSVFDKLEFINEHTLEVYPRLNDLNDGLKLLSCYNNIDAVDKLRSEIICSSEDKKALQELILAHNILKKHCEKKTKVLTGSKEIINKFLLKNKGPFFGTLPIIKFEESTPAVPAQKSINDNLGKEGKHREFITSFIFFAETDTADIEKQSNVIMRNICGFLNSGGGSLFIGINDEGQIIGLKEDYKLLPGKGNADAYERFIRKYIVRSFSNDVNGQIEFKFVDNNGREYLEVIIPELDRPISFNDEFFQRQGNETRILKGNDLILFLRRKMSWQEPTNHSKENSTISNPVSDSGFQENDKENEEVSEPDEEVVIAYFSLFLSGDYAITRSKPHTRNLRKLLPIKKGDEDGFLLQGYDNGCVNKIKISTLLKKRFGFEYKNGISEDGKLLFLSVIPDERLLRIVSLKDEVEYVKMYHTKNISVHELLYLKGNMIVPKNIDTLMSYSVVEDSYAKLLNRMIAGSKHSIGKRKNHPDFLDEFKILAQII